MVSQSVCGPVEKSKSNQVYYLEWTGGEGEQGSAWLSSKQQLDRVCALLRAKPNMSVTIRTHLVPRDKTMLVSWLNMQGVVLNSPTNVFSFQTGPSQD